MERILIIHSLIIFIHTYKQSDLSRLWFKYFMHPRERVVTVVAVCGGDPSKIKRVVLNALVVVLLRLRLRIWLLFLDFIEEGAQAVLLDRRRHRCSSAHGAAHVAAHHHIWLLLILRLCLLLHVHLAATHHHVVHLHHHLLHLLLHLLHLVVALWLLLARAALQAHLLHPLLHHLHLLLHHLHLVVLSAEVAHLRCAAIIHHTWLAHGSMLL